MGNRNLASRLPFIFGATGVLAAIFANGCGGGGNSVISGTIDKVSLGDAIFNDATMSTPGGQSCASCHVEDNAYVDPRQDSATSEGAIHGIFGNRQAPTLKYLSYAPAFHFDNQRQDYVGGLFWDGRAVDQRAQAPMPMLNPAEMNNASKTEIATKLKTGQLSASFIQIYGAHVFDTADSAVNAMADALATYQASEEFRPFTSKFDSYLKGQAALTPAEKRGFDLFNGKALCASCHTSAAGPNGEPPLFTNFTYSNIGLPKNQNSKFFTDPIFINPDGANFADKGLMSTTGRAQDIGRFKVPTLRNIAITGPYFHNGVITSLTQAVQFYNKRDSGIFGLPEFGSTQIPQIGNLGLADNEVDDIVAFLGTLTDGFTSPAHVVKPTK